MWVYYGDTPEQTALTQCVIKNYAICHNGLIRSVEVRYVGS